tara:strand:+ start:860 stop:1102 length:243 start_codon:yes stop_codon:yes gene_type:complete
MNSGIKPLYTTAIGLKISLSKILLNEKTTLFTGSRGSLLEILIVSVAERIDLSGALAQPTTAIEKTIKKIMNRDFISNRC